MNNGKITDFWPVTGGAMGESSGRSCESPRMLVEDFGGVSDGRVEEGEITPSINNLEQELQSLVDRFVSSIE